MTEGQHDMLMRFVRSNGQALLVECTSELNKSDGLVDDFSRGEFFEVEDFSLGAGLDDRSPAEEVPASAGVKPGNAQPSPARPLVARAAGRLSDGREADKPATKPRGVRYSGWLRGGDTRDFHADIEAIEFARLMDRGSTVFFHDLCNLKTFQSATLVKRRATDHTGGLQSYLRLDFTDLLMISLGWQDGDVPREKYRFICRQVLVQYKPSASSGVLGAAISGEWQHPPPPSQ